MKRTAILLGSVVMLALPAGGANAGPCTTEIENFSKTVAMKDAGSGPTPGANAGVSQSPSAAGQHPPTAAMSQAVKGAASPEDVRRQTAGQPTDAQSATTGAGAQHPPTAAMSAATQSQAAPATAAQHPPTAAMNEATKSQTAPQAGSSNSASASTALESARAFDKQGREADCMAAIANAKRAAGR